MRTGGAILVRLGRDGIAGSAICLAGIIGFAIVRDYPVGSLSEFGPGFMPWVTTIGMIGLGAAMVLRALAVGTREQFASISGRPLVLVPLGMAIFAIGLDPLGLVLASALAVFVTSLASSESSFAERVITSLGLSGLITLVFGYALSMSIPLWPMFIRS